MKRGRVNTTHKPNAPQQNTIYTSLAELERATRPVREARMTAGLERAFGELVTGQPSTIENLVHVSSGLKRDAALADSVQGSEPLTDNAIRLDIELGRTAQGLGDARQIRVWMILEETARKTGKNYVLRAELHSLVQSYGVRCSDRTLSRWLADGHDTYWIVTTGGHVRLIGYNKLAKKLSLRARASGLRDLVATNHPGQRRYMYVNVASNKLAEFEAAIYAAWLASRNNPTIARSTLKSLFNRDLSVLREWEQLAGIQIIENFGHYTAEFSADVPLMRTENYARMSTNIRWMVKPAGKHNSVTPMSYRKPFASILREGRAGAFRVRS